jgi:hypothetical protein
VTALDTSPLAVRVDLALADRQDDFQSGLAALRTFTDAPLFVCRAPGRTLGDKVAGVQCAEFAGKHPAGVPGFRIRTLFPVSRTRTAWPLDAHDVVRIGHPLRTGQPDVSHIVAHGGPAVRPPGIFNRRFLGFLRPDAPGYSSLPVYLGGGAKAGFDFMMVALLTLALVALAMGAMAIGVMLSGKTLKGSCGGVGSGYCPCDSAGVPLDQWAVVDLRVAGMRRVGSRYRHTKG